MTNTSIRIIKNTGYLYLRIGVSMVLSLWATRLIFNSLGVADYGLYNIIGGAIGMLGFMNLSMAKAVQRYMSFYHGRGDSEKCRYIFNVSLVLHFIVALCLGLVLIVAGWFFFHGILNIPDGRRHAAIYVYGCLVVSTAFLVMQVPYDSVLSAHENMLVFSLVGIVSSLLKFFAAYLTTITSYDKLIFYGVSIASINLFLAILTGIFCSHQYKECSIHPIRYWEKYLIVRIAKFAGWNFLSVFSSIVGNYGTGIVMNVFYGVKLNAAMGVANQVNGMLQTFSSNIQKALSPAIVKSEGAGKRQMMLALTASGCKFSFATLAVFAIPIIIEMQYVLKLWLGVVPEWAVLFSQLLLFQAMIEMLNYPFDQAILAEGRTAAYNCVIFILHLLPVVLLFLLFKVGCPPYTMYILGVMIFGFLTMFFRIYFAHTHCGLPFGLFYKDIWGKSILIFLVSFTVSCIPASTLNEGFPRLILTISFGFVSFILLFWNICLDQTERISISKLAATSLKSLIQ